MLISTGPAKIKAKSRALSFPGLQWTSMENEGGYTLSRKVSQTQTWRSTQYVAFFKDEKDLLVSIQ